MQKLQPALRAYLTTFARASVHRSKAGYVDTAPAEANQAVETTTKEDKAKKLKKKTLACSRETLIQCRQKSITTGSQGCTGKSGLNQSFPRLISLCRVCVDNLGCAAAGSRVRGGS